jgi:hypothetical protein
MPIETDGASLLCGSVSLRPSSRIWRYRAFNLWKLGTPGSKARSCIRIEKRRLSLDGMTVREY